MNIEFLKNITESFKNISSFFAFLFIYLIIRDIVEIINFGFDICDIKYFLSFNQLMYISVIISGFFLLIYTLGNKSVLNFFIILFFSICCLIFLSTELNRDTIIAIMIIVVIFVFHEKIFDLFNNTQKHQAIFFLILIFIFCPFIFLKIKEFNQIVKDSNNQPEFIFRKNIIGRIFDPKFFSPAQLEKIMIL